MTIDPLCHECRNFCVVKCFLFKKGDTECGLINQDYCKKKDKIVNIGNYFDKCDDYDEDKEYLKQEEIEIDREKTKKLIDSSEKDADIFRLYEFDKNSL